MKLLFYLLLGCLFFSLQSAERPNVLFIVCDDLNKHVSTSGYKHTKTPNMDKLAAAGIIFNRAYCQYPVCGPSRASFLSGLYPESTNIVSNKTMIKDLRPGTVSLPQMMKDAGYWSAGVGKIFHNTKTNPGETAWYSFEKFENERNPVVVRLQKAFEQEHGSIDKAANKKAWSKHLKANRAKISGQTPPGHGPTDMKDEEHKDGKNVREVVKWLDNKSYGDKPFFIACGIQKPHVPYYAPKKYFDMYPLDKLQPSIVPKDDWSDLPKLSLVKRYTAFGFEAQKENDELRREYMQSYHACITFLDAQVGLLFEGLKRNKLWDNTIIIFTSDHGYHLGEHFLWGKVTLFEECARVPMIARVPGMTSSGTKSEALVELVDIMPTIADLCNIQLPEKIHGSSFKKQLKDHTAPGKEVVYTVVSRGEKLGRSIRTQRWRYAVWGPGEEELYDLQKDPSEFNNLAKSPEFKSVQKEMAGMLGKRMKEASSLKHSKLK